MFLHKKTSVTNTEMPINPVSQQVHQAHALYYPHWQLLQNYMFSSRVTEDMKVQHIALLCNFAKAYKQYTQDKSNTQHIYKVLGLDS